LCPGLPCVLEPLFALERPERTGRRHWRAKSNRPGLRGRAWSASSRGPPPSNKVVRMSGQTAPAVRNARRPRARTFARPITMLPALNSSMTRCAGWAVLRPNSDRGVRQGRSRDRPTQITSAGELDPLFQLCTAGPSDDALRYRSDTCVLPQMAVRRTFHDSGRLSNRKMTVQASFLFVPGRPRRWWSTTNTAITPSCERGRVQSSHNSVAGDVSRNAIHHLQNRLPKIPRFPSPGPTPLTGGCDRSW